MPGPVMRIETMDTPIVDVGWGGTNGPRRPHGPPPGLAAMRHPRKRLTAIGLVLGFCAAFASTPQSVRAAELLGTDFDGLLYDVSFLTGATSNPRDTGVGTLSGIALSPGGDLFAFDAATNILFQINMLTGSPTPVGFMGLDVTEGDLDFQPGTGILFGVQTFGADRLFTIDVATGSTAVVGTIIDGGDISAMAFADDGTLYALDTRNEALYTLNPATAAILTSVGLSTPLGNAAGMDFDPDSGLLVIADGGYNAQGNPTGTNILYHIDIPTGILIPHGDTGLAFGLSGLEFVPEPGSLALLALGTVLCGRRRPRGRRS